MDHAACVRDARLNSRGDPEYRPANSKSRHEPPASAEASNSMHSAPFRLGEMAFAASARVSLMGRLASKRRGINTFTATLLNPDADFGATS
jgi:hypothetical protein